MVQTVQPDFHIKVGIKDGEVVSCDWSEMLSVHPEHFKSNEEMFQRISAHLKLASKQVLGQKKKSKK